MCTKHPSRWTRCDTWCTLRDAATAEWCNCLTLHDVLACWGRLGGKVCYHRHGAEHYREMGRRSGVARLKSFSCDSCGERFLNREMVEVQEEHLDWTLAFFLGEKVCRECAGDHGLL